VPQIKHARDPDKNEINIDNISISISISSSSAPLRSGFGNF